MLIIRISKRDLTDGLKKLSMTIRNNKRIANEDKWKEKQPETEQRDQNGISFDGFYIIFSSAVDQRVKSNENGQ